MFTTVHTSVQLFGILYHMTTTLDIAVTAGNVDFATSPERRGVTTARLNLLMEGPAHATHAALAHLLPELDTPVARKRAGTTLEFPGSEYGALVLENVTALDAEEQTLLHGWLNGRGRDMQLVCTAAHSLFPLVAKGLFDEALYYRLNTVLWRVDSTTPAA